MYEYLKGREDLKIQAQSVWKQPRRPILYYQNRERFLSRSEEWGSIIYNFNDDSFSARVRKLPVRPASPLSVYWLVAAPCNLKCVHCYGNVEELPKVVLSEIEQHRVADEIIESGAMRVTIAGGEPLLRKDTPDIVEKLADNNISVILGTNGSLLRASMMPSFRKANHVELSLDSHREETNNLIRPSRSKYGNSFRETLDAIKLCLDHGINLKVLTCLNKYNHLELESMADLLAKLGVKLWGISWTLNAGRAKGIYEDHVPADKQKADLLVNECKTKYPSLSIKYSNRTDREKNNRFSCLILPDGRVFAEDLVLGRKIPFHSLLHAPLVKSWSEANFNIDQHFTRWVGNRLTRGDINV